MKKLLVIGNGFDRTIGAKTSYNEFFGSEFYEDIKDKAFKWIESIELYENNRFPMNVNMQDFDFNCWDLLFCMESKYDSASNEKVNWCDVERIIHDSLIDISVQKFSWSHTFNLLHDHFYENERRPGDSLLSKRKLDFSHTNIKTRIMYIFLLNQMDIKEGAKDRSTFYSWLLNELKKFERSFGYYIRVQTENNDYREKAQLKAHQLIENEENLQVDSFNYSDFSNGNIDIRHINGDCSDPIFGIDLSTEEEKKYPEIRYFTKTSRRLHQDSHKLNRGTQWKPIEIDGAVVYGHSLNRMDYDYFNYLFTLLKFNTFDVEKMASVEFKYKVFNRDRENEIRNHQANCIYDLVSHYEDYVRGTNQHILINLLRFFGKLIITEF